MSVAIGVCMLIVNWAAFAAYRATSADGVIRRLITGWFKITSLFLAIKIVVDLTLRLV